jgi:hypothetical protein
MDLVPFVVSIAIVSTHMPNKWIHIVADAAVIFIFPKSECEGKMHKLVAQI